MPPGNWGGPLIATGFVAAAFSPIAMLLAVLVGAIGNGFLHEAGIGGFIFAALFYTLVLSPLWTFPCAAILFAAMGQANKQDPALLGRRRIWVAAGIVGGLPATMILSQTMAGGEFSVVSFLGFGIFAIFSALMGLVGYKTYGGDQFRPSPETPPPPPRKSPS